MLDDSEVNAEVNAEVSAVARERLSALVDGQLDVHAVSQACAHWRESTESRATWHAYHLIGDVLRSDDLASHPARDTAFVDALRAKLANEPVVLAPKPLEAPAIIASPASGRTVAGRGSRRWGWIAPSAVAAGFVAVVGVLTLSRPGVLPERNEATSVAQAPAVAPEPQTLVATGQVIRDARLDRYLAAHKQFAGSSALGVPSAYLRNATAEVATGR